MLLGFFVPAALSKHLDVGPIFSTSLLGSFAVPSAHGRTHSTVPQTRYIRLHCFWACTLVNLLRRGRRPARSAVFRFLMAFQYGFISKVVWSALVSRACWAGFLTVCDDGQQCVFLHVSSICRRVSGIWFTCAVAAARFVSCSLVWFAAFVCVSAAAHIPRQESDEDVKEGTLCWYVCSKPQGIAVCAYLYNALYNAFVQCTMLTTASSRSEPTSITVSACSFVQCVFNGHPLFKWPRFCKFCFYWLIFICSRGSSLQTAMGDCYF